MRTTCPLGKAIPILCVMIIIDVKDPYHVLEINTKNTSSDDLIKEKRKTKGANAVITTQNQGGLSKPGMPRSSSVSLMLWCKEMIDFTRHITVPALGIQLFMFDHWAISTWPMLYSSLFTLLLSLKSAHLLFYFYFGNKVQLGISIMAYSMWEGKEREK